MEANRASGRFYPKVSFLLSLLVFYFLVRGKMKKKLSKKKIADFGIANQRGKNYSFGIYQKSRNGRLVRSRCAKQVKPGNIGDGIGPTRE